jgi:hypothetical protein
MLYPILKHILDISTRLQCSEKLTEVLNLDISLTFFILNIIINLSSCSSDDVPSQGNIQNFYYYLNWE